MKTIEEFLKICENPEGDTDLYSDSLLKEAFKGYLLQSLNQLYLECEHGDEEHRQWLKDKFNDFYKKVANSQ